VARSSSLADLHFEGLKGSFTLTEGGAIRVTDRGDKVILTPDEYRKTATIQAVQISEDFTVNSEEGTLYAEAGDWLAEGPAGELWSIKEDIFAATYVPVETEPEILAHDRQVIVQTVSCQAAKKEAYDSLKALNLPIPPDLKAEVESQ
jgi:hypothetical protein